MKIKIKWSNPSPEKPIIVEVTNSIKEKISELETQFNDKILFFSLV